MNRLDKTILSMFDLAVVISYIVLNFWIFGPKSICKYHEFSECYFWNSFSFLGLFVAFALIYIFSIGNIVRMLILKISSVLFWAAFYWWII